MGNDQVTAFVFVLGHLGLRADRPRRIRALNRVNYLNPSDGSRHLLSVAQALRGQALALRGPTAHPARLHDPPRLRPATVFKTNLPMTHLDYWETTPPSQGFDEKRISRKQEARVSLLIPRRCPRCRRWW
jgi:hypothetical protein